MTPDLPASLAILVDEYTDEEKNRCRGRPLDRADVRAIVWRALELVSPFAISDATETAAAILRERKRPAPPTGGTTP